MSARLTVTDQDAHAVLRVALKGLSHRQRAISNNIANVDTPNFKATEVRFEGQLAAALRKHGGGLAMQRTSAAHLSTAGQHVGAIQPTEQVVTALTYRNDGNNVDIDAQMSGLAETQLRFAAVTQALNGHFGRLRTIISEGRRS